MSDKNLKNLRNALKDTLIIFKVLEEKNTTLWKMHENDCEKIKCLKEEIVTLKATIKGEN